jgi:hypothetical protein
VSRRGQCTADACTRESAATEGDAFRIIDAVGVAEPDIAAVGRNALRRMKLVHAKITAYGHVAVHTDIAVENRVARDVHTAGLDGDGPGELLIALVEAVHVGGQVLRLMGKDRPSNLRGDTGDARRRADYLGSQSGILGD